MGRSGDVYGMTSDMMRQLPPEPSRQESFEYLVMNFILDQKEKVKQLEEYMNVIGSDFIQLSLEVVVKLKEEIRIGENKVKKIKKIMSPQCTPQVLPSFEEYTSPVTYPEEVEETLGAPIKVGPLSETQLEDLGLNTCNHDQPLSPKEVPSFYEPEPQLQTLPNFPSLDVSLGDKTGPELPIKPHSPDSFRMKEVDKLTIHTPHLSHVASFHPKDTYCYYHPCIDDPKKHY
nr:ribonuclease H-like domain-containing protein [Tanacetum cinerariifolium]